MNWFQQLCRNAGLMIHNVAHPDPQHRQIVTTKVEEKRVSATTVVRRTTIEEIEIRPEKREE